MIKFFGLSRQYLGLRDELLDATDQVLTSGNLIGGPYEKELEDWISNRTQGASVILCHSGTQALEVIARYMLIRQQTMIYGTALCPAPVVTIPNLTFPATHNAWVTAGWRVKLADTDPNGLMSLTKENRINSDLACHVGLYGADPETETTIVYDQDVVDGAQHWLVPHTPIGFAMAISFDPTKNLPSSGNGGAIVTDDYGLSKWARNYISNGKPGGFSVGGTNSRLSEQDCAHLLVRTKYIDSWQLRRKQIDNYWCSVFENLPIRCLSKNKTRHAYHKFALYTPDRWGIVRHIEDSGIETRIHYSETLAEMPLSAMSLDKPDMLSISSLLSKGVFSLPLYPELTDGEVTQIAEAVVSYYK